MAHFAKVENNVVVDVIVASQEVIDGFDGQWIKTSYNTRGNVHYGNDGKPDGGEPLRKNFAGIGYAYDPTLDAFIPHQDYPSWTLNTETCLWEAPVAYPIDGKDYVWDEPTLSWIEIGKGA